MRSLGLVLLPATALIACGNSSGAPGTTGFAVTSTGGSLGSSTGASIGTSSATSAASTGTTAATTASSTSGSATSQGASTTGTTGAATSTGAGTTSGSNPYLDPDPASLPLVTNPSGNPVLSPISVVTVTFPGYIYTSQVQALGDYLASSNYITHTLAEYGVGTMTNTNVVMSQAAPGPTTTDVDIQTWILGNLSTFGGSLPAPATGFTPVYLIYYPSTTTITNEAGGASCQEFDGYHLEEISDFIGTSIYYAVIADCGTGAFDPGDLALVEWVAVHEIAEAATDPDDIDPSHDAWVDRDLSGAWDTTNYYITEVGDLCEGQTIVADAGVFEDGGEQTFTLTQLWSDDAALDGGAPCQPADPNRPYFNVLVNQTTQTVAAGSSAIFNLTGWSSGPFPAWDLTAYSWESVVQSTFSPTLSIGASSLSNGQQTTFTLGVPAGTPSGAVAGAYIYSYSTAGDGTYSFVPVIVTVQ